ncbi:MAG: class I SAM-dependent methyltransferase, partial [Deltaproteobacteria bacterium]|nr:class I SAM-dependent methyltransferase [Deltaproteobacteria bacterium]
LFANGLLIGIDSLPILHTETKREEFNEFITQLQKRVKFIRSYGEQLPFQDEIFNTVVCNNVIDHCQRPNLVVQEAYRVLKPQGYIILGVNCFSIIGLLKWRLYTTKRFAKSANVLAHPHNYLDKGVVKIIRKAGFEICAMNQVSMRKRVIGHQYRLYLIARK